MTDHAHTAAGGIVVLLLAILLQGVALSAPWISVIGDPHDDPCRTAAWLVVGALVAGIALVAVGYRELLAEPRDTQRIAASFERLFRVAHSGLLRERAERGEVQP